MKKRMVLLMMLVILSVISSFSLTGCGGNDNQGGTTDQTVKIKLAHWFAEDHPMHKAALHFKEQVEDRTGGNIIVEVYPNNQLGAEDVFVDSVKSGTVEMGIPGTRMSNDLPKCAVADMPFLFKDYEHAREALTGDLGDAALEGLIEASGCRSFGWSANGFRQLSSNKPMDSVDQIAGQRYRVPNVPHYIKMIENLKANPIAMPLSEVFTALEQKTVDGQDNPYATVKASAFYEVQKYMLETNHMFAANPWIINEKFYQSLSDENKKIIEECAKEAIALEWDWLKDYDNEAKQFLVDNGIKITVPDEAYRKQLEEMQIPTQEWFYQNFEGSEDIAKEIFALRQ